MRAEAGQSWFEPVDKASGVWHSDSRSESFARLWRAFMTARVTIASLLLTLQASIYALGQPLREGMILLCLAYFAAAVAVRVWAHPKPPGKTFDSQWLASVGVDVLAFSALNFLQSGAINYTALFALPVLLASVLGPILLALGTAASVTLLLLADAWWVSLQTTVDPTARFLQAGLSGSGFFVVALLANQLALRLSREEQRAQSSQSIARMQTQVNELVIDTLVDGVLVVDTNGIVRAANPASRRLLTTQGVARPAPFMLAADAAWQPLVELAQMTFVRRMPQQADVSLEQASGHARRLQVRTRLADSRDGSNENLCVMFLEDLREMEARVRTEKMAAMGRMSAAVAHEIRNPLAAIVQANALLEEDLQDAGHRQLTGMVTQNAQRLARIVEEILNISRVQEQSPQVETRALALDDTVSSICSDWALQNASGHRLKLSPGAAQAFVLFESEHLRRLMVNLLDNALRYASGAADAIQVSTQLPAPGQVRLSVWSDGQPLEKTVQSHLFEPFFSSESRSSGLGLYICRELCERHGALVGYQRVSRSGISGNEFFVIFRRADMTAVSAPVTFEPRPLETGRDWSLS
ncbi:MAG TPA: HAMP domain-containing sensor histidine kinase [Polaromonas sp.]|uniref:HAMP domain-containing sensor histidine kinase n=1 Tax=Polaromonas sp. TaxID=1869339 RepID=UPI002D328E7A|nr:HAMP domain-containing sensor histidine kinase [Polaromonas sp.]HYW58607.1 HAMP domain-containing sensor histidine kinase [Polaromonas sp.]